MDDLPTRGASEEYRRHLAGEINRRLQELSINQSELARRMNVSRDNVSGWCRATNYPRPAMIHRIASALNCTVSDLAPGGLVTSQRVQRNSFDASYDDQSNTMRIRMDMRFPMEAAMEIMSVINKAQATGSHA